MRKYHKMTYQRVCLAPLSWLRSAHCDVRSESELIDTSSSTVILPYLSSRSSSVQDMFAARPIYRMPPVHVELLQHEGLVQIANVQF